MKIVNKNNVSVELVFLTPADRTTSLLKDILDSDFYQAVVSFFKNSNFYMHADYIIPYKKSGVIFNFLGEPGINYRVIIGDFQFQFQGSKELYVPGEVISSRVLEFRIEREGRFFYSVNLAFTYYMIFIYVVAQILWEILDELDRIRVARYLNINTNYPIEFESVFGNLFGLKRFDLWNFDIYKEEMIQWIDSYLKYPGREKALKQIIEALGYVVYIVSCKKAWKWILGYSKLNNNAWVKELE